jgi:hypothetical protein
MPKKPKKRYSYLFSATYVNAVAGRKIDVGYRLQLGEMIGRAGWGKPTRAPDAAVTRQPAAIDLRNSVAAT